MNQHTSQALRIPVLLVAIHFMSGTRITFAQCEIQEDAKLTASNAVPDDWFGISVSVSGDVALVGDYGDDCGAGDYCGSAYVYRFDGNSWVQQAKLTASDAALGDLFGRSVCISGNLAVVGASNDDTPAGPDCGSAYVYRFNGNIWVQQSKLTASDAGPNDYFGYSVSLSGDVVIVGAFLDNCAPSDYCGSAYVYRFNGSTWVQQGKLTASDAAQGDYFGWSVSVSGDTAVVGAYGDDCAVGIDCGSAYIYHFNGSTWVQQGKLTAADAAGGDYFGYSVSVSGDVAVVGAHGGSAYIYRFNEGTWVQEAKLTASDAGAYFGYSVCVSGGSIVVGAYRGTAHVYRFNGSTWVQQVKLTDPDAGGSDFGNAVSLSGDVAIVGAPADHCPSGDNCGSAYVYALPADCTGYPLCADCNSNAVPDECDIFGCMGDPACEDCNANLVPDGCDIAGGMSVDTNVNGVPDECEPDSIPTVSELGLVILTLLLLTSGKVVFCRPVCRTSPAT